MEHLHVVLDPVTQFPNQRPLLHLRASALADIGQDVHGADQPSRRVMQRRGIGQDRAARAIRPFDNKLDAPEGLASLERHGHGALVMGKRRAVWPVEAPGHAPAILAERGSMARKLDSGPVAEGDSPFGIRGVDRGRKGLQHLMKIRLAAEAGEPGRGGPGRCIARRSFPPGGGFQPLDHHPFARASR